jgi:hypothetical protein
MKRLLCASALVALLVASGTLAAAGSLDGKTFSVQMGKKGKSAGNPDDLIFADGTFRSTACDKYGFTAAAYEAKQDGDKTTFTATAKSAKQGTMVWTGTVQGDAVSGEASWNRVRRQPVRYWFKGSTKK